jgi:hypothetical protein
MSHRKQAALYRSEKENATAHALVKFTFGKATVLLSTVEMGEHQSPSERNREKLLAQTDESSWCPDR